ncbi:5-(carboxyamino)imidazole ribonucleotide mutase, partial [Serratia marcescens]
ANAGLLAMQILALHDAALAQRLADWRQAQTEDVLNHPDPREDA